MRPFHPRPEDLPREFAVFPLSGALLLPGSRLPLNIFEPRYLAMVEDSLAQGRMFGMIQPDPTRPSGPAGSALYRIGCLGRLASFSETEDGRFLITLTGLIRFQVAEELAMRRGYRRVRGAFAPWLRDLEPGPHPAGPPRDELTPALRAYFAARGLQANWDAIAALPDEALVSTLCMVCPFSPAEKQALLEAPTPADRGGTLLALLRMGVHEPVKEPGAVPS